MSDQSEQMRGEAKVWHQRGEYQKAHSAYEGLMGEYGEDADTLGLLALCKFQMGEHESAFAMWQQSNAMPTEARIAWRNLSNAMSAALATSGDVEPKSLLPDVIQIWDQDVSPAPADLKLVQSFAVALERTGAIDVVRRLLPTFIAHLNITCPEVLEFLRWVLEKNFSAQINGAIKELLDRVDEPNPEILLLQGAYFFSAGDTAGSEHCAEEVARAAPVYLMDALDTQKFTVAVLNRPAPAIVRPMSLAEFHFGENTPGSLVKQFSGDLRLLSFFPTMIGNLHQNFPNIKPDVVLNNWATAELLGIPGVLERLNQVLAKIEVPVLNAPNAVALTTRQRNAEILQDVTGVLVPKVVRFDNWAGNQIPVALMLEQEIGYPLILREPFQQMGRGAIKVETPDMLLTALAKLGAGQFYAIAFVDNPLGPSLYRKFRAAVIGEKIFITHVHFNTDWNVHRIRDEELRRNVETMVERVPGARTVLDDGDTEQSKMVMRALEGLRRNIPLDIFGVDFDLMPDGRLLFFEANAAMNISFSEARGKTAVRANMKTAFMELIGDARQRTSAKTTGAVAGQ